MQEYALIIALVVIGLLILDRIVGLTGKIQKASDWLPRIVLGLIIFVFSSLFPPLAGLMAHLTGIRLLHSAVLTGLVLILVGSGFSVLLLTRDKKPVFLAQAEDDDRQELVMSPKPHKEPERSLSEPEKRVDTMPITDTMGIGFAWQVPQQDTTFNVYEAALEQQSSGNYLAAVDYYRAFLLSEPTGEEAQWAVLNMCAALNASGNPQLAASYLNGELRSFISDNWYRDIVENLNLPSGI